MPPKKRKAKRKASSKSPRLSVFKTILWASVILLTGLSLFVAMKLPIRLAVNEEAGPAKAPATRATQERKTPDTQAHQPRPPARAAGETPRRAYEVVADDFDKRVRNVDLAILQALDDRHDSHDILRHRAVEARTHKGQEFFYQNLTISLGQDVFEFLARLQQNLKRLEPGATLTAVNSSPRDLEISILGEPTHHIFLPLSLAPPTPEPAEPAATAGRLVIIIDDLGESMTTARRLADLPFKVTFSVLPHNTKARQVAQLARREGLELLMHLPCEPEGYPTKADSGPGTLKADMSEAELERLLADNFSRLPEVDGVNNHMGSRLTKDARAMTVVLSHLKGRGKFFVDSLTTPDSSVRKVSKKLGMRYYRRHVFLDNSATEHAILLQLKKAESLAKRTGVAVAIGHPYPETLSALETWAKTRDMTLSICTIQDI
jgi:polysaccharide deacetylase 2 family uncharacterized protein YibQ